MRTEINVFLVVFVLFTGMSVEEVRAQSGSVEPIEIIEKGLFKKKVYKKCGIEMEPVQLLNLFKDDPGMQDYVKPLGVNLLMSKLLAATAGILVGYPVVDSFSKDSDPNWNLAYIGAGCALLSIPFTKWFDKNAKEAIDFHNAGYQSAHSYRPRLRVQMGGHGLGLALKF
ncbi:hypothetical protein [Echinicola rosea]|uniref:Uncharacterized protein n=1 Tax=Echinicola rosea TaxID=1807691 RepID=A0ABQ1V6E6_9BACT|nr:hypothetical protein [Echinicola rosea]GGF40056.1 hypothetical protein GCM10011339_30730 [Echinicola rosea]